MDSVLFCFFLHSDMLLCMSSCILGIKNLSWYIFFWNNTVHSDKKNTRQVVAVAVYCLCVQRLRCCVSKQHISSYFAGLTWHTCSLRQVEREACHCRHYGTLWATGRPSAGNVHRSYRRHGYVERCCTSWRRGWGGGERSYMIHFFVTGMLVLGNFF